MTDPGNASRARPARTAHHLTVSQVRQPAARVVAVTLQGDSLAGFSPPNPGGHIKIAFESADGGRPIMRTYTPRRFDPERRELEVEFVLHGSGVAAAWASAAQVGDPLTVMGPGGRYRPSAASNTFVIAVDDSAIPAAGTIVDALPPDVELHVVCEVTDRSDERPLTSDRAVDVTWLHRAGSGAAPGALLQAAVEALPADLEADWFVACEAGAMRRIRHHLLAGRGIAAERLQTRGYWRSGQEDYPDHDYGEDDEAETSSR